MKGNVLSVERTSRPPPRSIFDGALRCGPALAHRRLGDAPGAAEQGRSGSDPGYVRDADEDGACGTRRSTGWSSSSPTAESGGRPDPGDLGAGGGRPDLALRGWSPSRGDPGEGELGHHPDHQRVLFKLGGIYSSKTRRDMERTLARLDALVTA